MNSNTDAADAAPTTHVNTDRGANDLNEKGKGSLPDPNRCPNKVPLQRDRTDLSTGEITTREIYKPCDNLWCPTCGPRKRAQMWAHYRRKLGSLEDLYWVGFTQDEKTGLTPAESRHDLKRKRWRNAYRSIRRRCDGKFNYLGTIDQEKGGQAHIHVVMSAPGVDEQEIRSVWFRGGGGIDTYVEKIEDQQRLDQAVGYVLKRHFEQSRHAKKEGFSAQQILRSHPLAFESEEAKQTRKEIAQQRAADSGGVVSFASEEEYVHWLCHYLDNRTDRQVRVNGVGEGTAIQWDGEEVAVHFPNREVEKVSPVHVLPAGLDDVYIDAHSSDVKPRGSRRDFDFDDPKTPAPEPDLEKRSTECEVVEDGERVRYFWDEDTKCVRREKLSGPTSLDVYRERVRSNLTCPLRSGWIPPSSQPDSDETSDEVWEPVVGFEMHYSVSNKGNVRRNGKTKPLKPFLAGAGYPYVCLSVDGEVTKQAVHTLVAKAFHGSPPGQIGRGSDDYQVNHKNGDITDNRAENLEWLTHEENKKHAAEARHLGNPGEKHGNSKLTWSKVARIREEYADSDVTQAQLASKFGVSRSLIHQVIHKRIWKPSNRPKSAQG